MPTTLYNKYDVIDTYRADRDAAAKGLFGGEEVVRARLHAANKSDLLLKKSLARHSKPYDSRKTSEIRHSKQEPAREKGDQIRNTIL